MRRVGLTGGIGSGKSTVARLLADRGAYVVDADVVAREVVAPGTPGLAQVAAAFAGVLRPDGSLDRAALSGLVFGDTAARRRLEAITHPLIAAATAQRLRQVPADGIFVHDLALLVELGLAGNYDFVLVVQAPLHLRLRRLAERGLDQDQARQRIAAQATDEQRAAVADLVIDNGADLAHLRAAVERAWPRLAPA
ncbi:MAG TPA: dephospho-CoA kinase [Mycobacteriales bacterium]|jgi:dephospho-CoA kinase|nr:dephospho-CoA kinase [Mycobacteriales bacterium]